MMQVGVLSDTHGLLRPEALAALAGSEHILHAGDVGDPDILEQLRRLAPLTAIRGNIDREGICAALPASAVAELGQHLVYLVHAYDDIDIKPSLAGVDVVIFGHSHKPSLETKEGVLYLNPGSAGRRRFHLPITLARLTLNAGLPPSAELVTLLP